jgi:hypothetical protein
MGANLPPDQLTNGDTTVDMEFKAEGLRHKDRRWPDMGCFHDKVLTRRAGEFSVAMKMARAGKTLDRLAGSGVVPPALVLTLDAERVAAGPAAELSAVLTPAIEEAYYQDHGRMEVLLLKVEGPKADAGDVLADAAPDLGMNHAWRLVFDLGGRAPGWYAVKVKFYDGKEVAFSVFKVFQIETEPPSRQERRAEP